MPLIYQKRYNRRDIQENPHIMYVFGDNLQRKGYGGQAKEARGEPNAIGFPTKRYPANNAKAFLSDSDLQEVKESFWQDYLFLLSHLNKGGKVVWPSDGIGTGLADLSNKAPSVYKWLQTVKKTFESKE